MAEKYEGEESYRKPYESEMTPVTNDQQLGQDILRTFARISDPPIIEIRKVTRDSPVFDVKTIVDADGTEKQVEYIAGFERKTWEYPILIQPKYHELITDDISRAFLSDGDLEVARCIASYCKAVKSFADRYELDLSVNHNNFVDDALYLIVSSGASRGKRVQLAKTNIAEQTYRASSIQEVGELKKKKKGFLESVMNP